MIKSCHASAYTYNCASGQWQSKERSLIMEIPLQIWVNEKHLVTLHRTPGNDFLLATGYLYYQGLINDCRDILTQRLVTAEEDTVESPLATDSVHFNIKKQTPTIKPLTAALIWSVISPQTRETPARPFALDPQLIASLPDEMIKEQELYTSTAGAHAVALVDNKGCILHCEEDVGRTNALDKIVGYCITNNIAMNSLGALFSGRINLEMAVKISRAGFPMIFSVSAPTASAVEILKQAGVTYAGSLKGASFTLFCGSLQGQ